MNSLEDLSVVGDARVAGVTFRRVGKVHYYEIGGLPLEIGGYVVAHTERGTERGEVKILRDIIRDADEMPQAYRILRCSTPEDDAIGERRVAEAVEALSLCQGQADALRLDMKIIDAEISFDGQVATFYFVADSRVDFRQLVREVAGVLHRRVLLQQVGTRDHAKLLGGYGPCGRPLCCTTFLRDFAPVSMKMARDQSLYLNPSKFSGVCGKLMCCLRYEHDVYTEARERLPVPGMFVVCPDGSRGEVIETDIFREMVTVLVRGEDETRQVRHKADAVQVARACGDCGSATGGEGCDSEKGAGGCGTCASRSNTDSGQPLISLDIRRR